jgi:hypothetical protein
MTTYRSIIFIAKCSVRVRRQNFPARPRRSALGSKCLTRMPSRDPRSFARIPSSRVDLLQCAIGRCRLDPGDQTNQPVVPMLWPGAVQQAAFNETPPAGRRTVRAAARRSRACPPASFEEAVG